MISWLKRIKNYFSKKEEEIHLGKVGIIDRTESSMEAGINDKFNKTITVYESVSLVGDEIRWGRVLDEFPYTEEEALNLISIKEIPVVERKFINDFKFNEGESFGGVVN